jgi:hypothetical protein
MRKTLRILIIIVITIVVLATLSGLYVKVALPGIRSDKDLKIEVTTARVARGQYLARSVAGCMHCHSAKYENLFANPVKEDSLGSGGECFSRDKGFPGMIYSPNITPYHLGNWTDGEILRAITEGESKDGRALFPIMNYPAYAKMDQEDIFSIIAYLRTLPSITSTVPPTSLDFPMNFIVNTIPAKAVPGQRPDTGNAVEYGHYLVTMASCIECHSKVNKGQIIPGTEFGGGRQLGILNGKPIYSTNITPDHETGIGNWSKDVFIAAFTLFRDSALKTKTVAPGEFNPPMPWLVYKGMKDSDLAAIYAYLQTLKPIHNTVPNP